MLKLYLKLETLSPIYVSIGIISLVYITVEEVNTIDLTIGLRVLKLIETGYKTGINLLKTTTVFYVG